MKEVLLEPGSPRLWVTVVEGVTHLLDCESLLATERGSVLRLPRVWRAVHLSVDSGALCWPGLTLGWSDARQLSCAAMPSKERYRPLLPYLRGHEPPLHPMPPATVQRVQMMFGWQAHHVQRASQALQVEPELARQRLYDIGLLLAEYVGHSALTPLLRRPWPVARRLQHPRIQSMQDCLLTGRPDLVERALIALVLEGQ